MTNTIPNKPSSPPLQLDFEDSAALRCRECGDQYSWDDPEQSEDYCPCCCERVEEGMHPLSITIDLDSKRCCWIGFKEEGKRTRAQRMSVPRALYELMFLFNGHAWSEEVDQLQDLGGDPGEDFLERARRLVGNPKN